MGQHDKHDVSRYWRRAVVVDGFLDSKLALFDVGGDNTSLLAASCLAVGNTIALLRVKKFRYGFHQITSGFNEEACLLIERTRHSAL